LENAEVLAHQIRGAADVIVDKNYGVILRKLPPVIAGFCGTSEGDTPVTHRLAIAAHERQQFVWLFVGLIDNEDLERTMILSQQIPYGVQHELLTA
jgi:hypothetical protein